MGLLDDLLRSALSQAKVSNPLMLALLALLGSGALFGGGDSEAAPTKTGGPRSPADEGGGLLEGLGGLLDRFRQSGQGKAANSWIGTGPNEPVSPGQARKRARAEHHQDARRAVRLVGGGTAQAAVAGSPRCGG